MTLPSRRGTLRPSLRLNVSEYSFVVHASTSLVLAMLKLVLEVSFYEGVLHRIVMVLQAIHGLNLRLVSPRSHLGTSLLPGLYDQLSVGTNLFSRS